MAKREGPLFFCPQCGAESPRWMGFCSACGSREPLVEAPRQRHADSRWLAPATEGPQELSQVSLDDFPRILLPYPELNRVLGGGVVPGSVVLMAGDPGIGKSTLLLQVAQALTLPAMTGKPGGNSPGVLYVSGEESAPQVRMRAERLGVSGQGLFLLGETDLQGMLRAMDALRPRAVVVDSIQTVSSDAVPTAPGSVAQVRECARVLMGWAKARRTPLFMSGHVTKEGDVAGPRVLEHIVDVVLYLEGESLGPLRILRSVKNRFGSTNEVALFQMEQVGLVEVSDPSLALMSGREGPLVGSAVVPVVEGTRPLLVEVQALTVPTHAPAPTRAATGLERNRLLMLAAVLDRRAGLPLAEQDIFVKVAGGLRITEPAADLAVALAIASSLRNAPLAPGLAAVGEVGLTGEVRGVSQVARRVQEASRLGLQQVLVPAAAKEPLPADAGIQVVPVHSVAEAISRALPQARRGQRAEDALEKLSDR